MNEIELDEVLPDSVEPSDWLKGERIASPPENLRLDFSLISEDDYGSLILSFLPMFHSSFVQALTDFGIDTIQYTPVVLRQQESDEIRTSYSLANIVALYDCMDKNKSKIDTLDSNRGFYIKSLVIDERKTNGAKIFRMQDDPRLIIVTEDLKDYLESLTDDLELYHVSFVKTEEYSDWLEDEPYWSSLELKGLTKKLFHLLHKWGITENDSYLERAKILLEKGANANFKAIDGDTALNMACSIKMNDGGVQLAKLFIQFGADINQDKLLWRASYRNNVLFADFLLEQGVVNGLESSLTTAIERNHPFIVKAILDKSTINRYAMVKDDLGYTPLHLAVAEGREEIIKIMLPYYDLEKCTDIMPLDSLSKKKSVRTLLGITVSDAEVFSDIDIDNLDASCVHCKTDVVFLTHLSRAQSLYKEMTTRELMIDGYLMPWDALLSVTIPALKENLIESFEIFKRDVEQPGRSDIPLQALYIEYAGAVTDPFDAVAMANGYAHCDESLNLKKELFSESGTFDFGMIYEGMDELTENFPNVYSEMQEYLSLVSFLHLHISFSHFVRTDAFHRVSTARPFYLIGNEHDYDPILIYKLESFI